MPLAVKWAIDQEEVIMCHGKALDAPLHAEAGLAGVRCPEKIRIYAVSSIPMPVDGLLWESNRQIGLVTEDTVGLTLNYGIFVRKDYARLPQLVFHEFVHVAQYERLGGTLGFLSQYLEECVIVGHSQSPLEREAIEATQRREAREALNKA